MYFQNLPKEQQLAIKSLTKDQEFQRRFSTDPVLDKLDEEKFDPSKTFGHYYPVPRPSGIIV